MRRLVTADYLEATELMRFGRHCGTRIVDVPVEYLKWVLKEVNPKEFNLRAYNLIKRIVDAHEKDTNSFIGYKKVYNKYKVWLRIFSLRFEFVVKVIT
jgi:uncharacterized protein (DUF3820 family)